MKKVFQNPSVESRQELDEINDLDQMLEDKEVSKRRNLIAAAGGLVGVGLASTYASPALALSTNDVITINNINDLKQADTAVGAVIVLGKDNPGDGGGDLFIWDSASSEATNNVTVVDSTFTSSGGRWLRSPLGSAINVKWFGATGDGQTDDTAAVKAAIEFIASRNNGYADFVDRVKPSLYFPSGIYRLTESGVFSHVPQGLHHLNGFRVHGDGWRASVLKLDVSSTSWFYDNDPSGTLSNTSQHYIWMQFENLMFRGTDSFLANGFRTTSIGHEQGFSFLQCFFTELNRVIETNGSSNASENKFIECWITKVEDAVWVLNNQQSVVNEFHCVDVQDIRGDFIRVDQNGGGSFRMYGGTLVFTEHTDPSRITWLVNAQANSGTLAGGNNDFLFVGTKHEMLGTRTGIVSHPPVSNTSLRVLFQGANFYAATGNERPGVQIALGDRVAFDNCTISEKFTYFIESGTDAFIYGNNGALHFDNCDIDERLPELIHFNDEAGSARARGCRYAGIGGLNTRLSDHLGQPVPNEYLVGVAMDFDLLPNGEGYGECSNAQKVLYFGKGVKSPYSGNHSHFAVLPPGAIMTGLYVKKVALGGSVAPYQMEAWHLGDTPAGDVLLGSSTAALNRDEHIIDLPSAGNRLMRKIGSANVNGLLPTTRSRTIEIRADNGNESHGFEAWVFYI